MVVLVLGFKVILNVRAHKRGGITIYLKIRRDPKHELIKTISSRVPEELLSKFK